MKYFLYLNFDDLYKCAQDSKYIAVYFANELGEYSNTNYISPIKKMYHQYDNSWDSVAKLSDTLSKYLSFSLDERIELHSKENSLFVVYQKDELDVFRKMFPEHFLLTCEFNLKELEPDIKEISDKVVRFDINVRSKHKEPKVTYTEVELINDTLQKNLCSW